MGTNTSPVTNVKLPKHRIKAGQHSNLHIFFRFTDARALIGNTLLLASAAAEHAQE